MTVEFKNLIVTVDGGGSTCRICVCDGSGNVLGAARGGPANIATNFDEALSNIQNTVDQAYKAAGIDPARKVNDFAYLGLAGAGLKSAATRMENALGFMEAVVTTDQEITVFGATNGEDGAVAAIGTGSFFFSRRKDITQYIGGWGFQLGDDGGGAILGQTLLRQTILAHDGINAHSPLSRTVLERFGGTPRGLVSFVQTATPKDYGTFAPSLIEAYYNNDTIALSIVAAAVSSLHHTLDVLNAKECGALYLLGGLGPVYKELLNSDYRKLCVSPKGDASDGALALAKLRWARDLE